MATITISIPDTLKDFLTKQMKAKGYGNVSEYFRDLLRQAQERETDNKMETLLMDQLKSGKQNQLTRDLWDNLREAVGRKRKRGKSQSAAHPVVTDRVARLTAQFIDQYRDVLRRLA
jgi:antitoxin ParD1/3/4